MSDSYDVIEEYGHWLQWQILICALILIVCIITYLLHIVKAKVEPLSYNHLWIPRWRNVNPLWLLLYRVFAFLCMALIHIDIIAFGGLFSFNFYTQWTFTLVTIYFALGTIVSAYGCWKFLDKSSLGNEERDEFLRKDLEECIPTKSIAYKEKETRGPIKLQCGYVEEEFQQGAGFWGYLMQITYQTCAGAVVLTDMMYWCVIVPWLSVSVFKMNMLIICVHTLNAVFLLVDTALNNLPFPWFRLAYFVLWSCGYIIFQWVLHACCFKWWPYPFLQLDSPWAPIWYILLVLLHIPCYGMYSLVVKATNTFFLRLFPYVVRDSKEIA